MLLHHVLLRRDSTWGASQGPVCLRARGDAQQFPAGRLLTALLTSAGLLNEAEFLHKQQREASLPNFSQMLGMAPGRGTPPAPGLAGVGACGQTANVCPRSWASPCTQLSAGTKTFTAFMEKSSIFRPLITWGSLGSVSPHSPAPFPDTGLWGEAQNRPAASTTLLCS